MARTATYQPTILLVGNTNVGKSTLFNGVTGAHQAMVNAPGTTVEMLAGTWKKLGARIIDLPGTYSLIPKVQTRRWWLASLPPHTANTSI